MVCMVCDVYMICVMHEVCVVGFDSTAHSPHGRFTYRLFGGERGHVTDTVVDGHTHGKGNTFLDGASLDLVAIDALGEVHDHIISCLADVEDNGAGNAHFGDGLDDGVTDDSALLILGNNVGVGCGRWGGCGDRWWVERSKGWEQFGQNFDTSFYSL